MILKDEFKEKYTHIMTKIANLYESKGRKATDLTVPDTRPPSCRKMVDLTQIRLFLSGFLIWANSETGG